MKRGDHLVTERTGYTHHGLYLGDNKVIHYAGFSDGFDKEKIEVTSYQTFTQDKNTYVKDCMIRVYNAEESVERAYSRLGEDSYNLVFNNCEHFVTWCIQGIHRSEQVETVREIYEYMEKEWKEKSENEIFKQVVKGIANENLIKHTISSTMRKEVPRNIIASSVGKSIVTNTVGTTAGVATASAITGGTVAGVTTAIAAGSVATVAAPIVVAAGVGYGVTKVIDWLLD